MPKTALTCDDTGRLVVPTGSVEWDGWVSASRTRNHVLGDPLVDWLDCYGEMKGYERDRPDPRTDYLGFVFRKGRDFETRVISYLTRLRPGGVRTIVSADASLSRVVSLDAAEATWEAMAEGTPIIYQGVLWDARHRVYGAPDLLVRSDTLLSLFHQSLHPAQVTVPATDLDIGDRHYVIVDIKYSTLRFNACRKHPAQQRIDPGVQGAGVVVQPGIGTFAGPPPCASVPIGPGVEQDTKRGDGEKQQLYGPTGSGPYG